MIELAFCGMRGMGGPAMRGERVAAYLGVPFFEVRDPLPKCRNLVLVKYPGPHSNKPRMAAERLLHDPIDIFSSWKGYHDDPPRFWKHVRSKLHIPNDFIATSPSCGTSMIGTGCNVHYLPHQCDESLSECYNANGPVVYAGGRQYIAAELDAIISACKFLGRDFQADFSKQPNEVLKGAALILHPRCAPHNDAINQVARPQTKAENAAACGIPILATDHKCVRTVRPEACFKDEKETWTAAIFRALKSEPLKNPVTLQQHAENLLKIIEGK